MWFSGFVDDTLVCVLFLTRFVYMSCLILTSRSLGSSFLFQSFFVVPCDVVTHAAAALWHVWARAADGAENAISDVREGGMRVRPSKRVSLFF